MRCALIGCGVIGRVHAATIAELNPDIELVMAVDGELDAARAIASEHGATPVRSVEEALANPHVDAVAICTPSGTHARLAVAAMHAGKDVVVEKPLDVTLDAARPVATTQRATGRTLAMISQHRFAPASQVVQEAVRNGRFGRLTSGVASIPWWRGQDYYDTGEWRGTLALDGGGAIITKAFTPSTCCCACSANRARCSPGPAAWRTRTSKSKTPLSPRSDSPTVLSR